MSYLAKDREGKEIFKGCHSFKDATKMQATLLAAREAVQKITIP